MNTDLDDLNPASKVLYAALIGTMSSGDETTTSYFLQSRNFASCAFNQGVYLEHLLHIGLIDMDNEKLIKESENEDIDIAGNYKVTLEFKNDNKTIKNFISDATSLQSDKPEAKYLRTILKMEIIGECFSFLSHCLANYGFKIPLGQEPPEIIETILRELSLNEAGFLIENALYNLGKGRLRIMLSMDNKDEVLDVIYEEIRQELNQSKYTLRNAPYSIQRTASSMVSFVLGEYCSMFGPDYWKDSKLWSRLKL